MQPDMLPERISNNSLYSCRPILIHSGNLTSKPQNLLQATFRVKYTLLDPPDNRRQGQTYVIPRKHMLFAFRNKTPTKKRVSGVSQDKANITRNTCNASEKSELSRRGETTVTIDKAWIFTHTIFKRTRTTRNTPNTLRGPLNVSVVADNPFRTPWNLSRNRQSTTTFTAIGRKVRKSFYNHCRCPNQSHISCFTRSRASGLPNNQWENPEHVVFPEIKATNVTHNQEEEPSTEDESNICPNAIKRIEVRIKRKL